MARLVGESFETVVKDQIKQRQITAGSGFNNTSRTTEQLLVQNNQNTWLKLGSSVNIIKKEQMLELGLLTNKKLTIDDFKDRVDGVQRLKDIGITETSRFMGKNLAMKSVLFNSLSDLTPSTYSGEKTDRKKTTDGSYNFRAGVNTQQNQIWNSNNAYGLGGNLQGIVPPPGLIDASIESLNRGSIRKAVVNIKAYNKFQFELIELLYIRLGYTMLLEWGNDKFINNKGELQKMGNTLMEDIWFVDDKTINFRGLIRKVNEYHYTYSGNYDGFVGKVSNFNWDFDTDGTYNITLNLISLGDVVESIKVNNPQEIKTEAEIETTLKDYRTKTSKKNEYDQYEEIKDSPIVTNAGTSGLAYSLFLDLIENTDEKWWGWKKDSKRSSYLNLYWALGEDKKINKTIPDQPPRYTYSTTIYGTGMSQRPAKIKNPKYDEWEKTYGKVSNTTPPLKTNQGEGVDVDRYSYFLTFGELLKKVQMLCIPRLSGDSMIGIDNEVATNIMSVYPNQISLDPKVCLVRPNFTDGLSFNNPEELQKGKNGIRTYYDFIPRMKDWMVTEGCDGLIYGQTMNIYLNYDFVAQCLAKTTKKGEIFLYKFLQSICDGINESLGGVPNLEPVIQDDLTLVIQDQNKIRGIETSTKFKSNFIASSSIDLYGYSVNNKETTSNIVREFGFKTKIDPSLASMISIGATANGSSTKNYDATAFSSWNSGLKDQYQFNFQDPEGEIRVNNDSEFAPLTENEVKLMAAEFKRSDPDEFTPVGAIRPSFNKDSSRFGHTFKSARDIDKCPVTKDYWWARTWEEYVDICINYKLNQIPPKRPNAISPSYIKYLIQAFTGKIAGQTNTQQYYFLLNSEFIRMGKSLFKSYVNSIDNNIFVKTGSPSTKIGFIPVSMDLTLDGIGGAKIFQRLNINQEYLPSQYPKALEFIITKINHKISDNNWETSFSTISVPRTKAEDLSEFLEKDIIESILISAENQIKFENLPEEKKYTISPNSIELYNPNIQGLQYLDEETTKTQIVLHHTAGRRGAEAEIKDWIKEQPEVLTHYIIERSGLETYVFNTKYWAYHLGGDNGKAANKRSISIELVAIGFVTENASGQWIDNYGTEIKEKDTALPYRCTGPGPTDFEVMTEGFRGHKRYQKYTTEQIKQLELTLKSINWDHNIEINMNAKQWKAMFPPEGTANYNIPGILSHNTFRSSKDKTDIFPQLELLQMLQKFNNGGNFIFSF